MKQSEKNNVLKLSNMRKTWILDMDGTLVVHDGYLYGEDILLDGVKEFFAKIHPEDRIVIITARPREYKERTIRFLDDNGLRYDDILFGVPTGERILINDRKTSGLKTAFAYNKDRNGAFDLDFRIDDSL